MTFDIISLGSASMDVFVKTKSEIVKHNHHLDLAYLLGGKILIDELHFTTGGGGSNTAVAFARLGLKTGFIGCLGNDENGKMLLHELKKEGVAFLGKVKEGQTGYSIILAGTADRTILTSKGLNNHLEKKDIQKAESKWLYVSTMLEESEKTVKEIIKKTNAKIAINISSYLAEQGFEKLKPILSKASIVILNKEEAQILTRKDNEIDALIAISKHIAKGGIVVITDSFNPVHAFSAGKFYKKTIRKILPADRTGAGDAFAAGFVYGMIKGKPIQKCLDYGNKEALAVLKHIGAKNNLLRKL